MENETIQVKRKTRSNYKRTERLRAALATIHRQAKRLHWSCDTLIAARAEVFAEATRLGCTGGERDYLYGYGRALFDAVNDHMEWRLGLADVTTSSSAGYSKFCEAWGAPPTHGGHFWPGTDHLFGKWEALK